MSGRKVFLIIDGASDDPIDQLHGKTPLEAAYKPNIDRLAKIGEAGQLWTIPDGLIPGSDVANLMLLGYDPTEFYTGRGPLEAASMNIELCEGDIAFRVNTVSISDDNRMKDYSAGHISTEESRKIIESMKPLVDSLGGMLYPGVQYRHLMRRRDGFEIRTFPPHDFIGTPIAELMPGGVIGEIVNESRKLLINHPVNIRRRENGKNTADALWPWGQGRAVKLPTLRERYEAKGSLISAVDLIRGIGVLAGFRILKVPGITGYFDTNYRGKGEFAVDALKSVDDVVVIHVEATDEAGHEGEIDEKVKAIEAVDKEIVGKLLEEISDLAIAITPDHPTYLKTGKHGSSPVPFLFADTTKPVRGPELYCERTSLVKPIKGSILFDRLMNA